MSKKDAINVAFYQSILYLIIGMILGLMSWEEHRYILLLFNSCPNCWRSLHSKLFIKGIR